MNLEETNHKGVFEKKTQAVKDEKGMTKLKNINYIKSFVRFSHPKYKSLHRIIDK